jgi:hypothetical protein
MRLGLQVVRQRVKLTDYTEKVRTIDAWKIGPFRILFAQAAGQRDKLTDIKVKWIQKVGAKIGSIERFI